VPWYIKVNTLGRLCNNDLERAYSHFNYQLHLFYLKLHIILSFYSYSKTFTSVIFSQTFSMQLGAGTMPYCLSQYAIPFCTLLVCQRNKNHIETSTRKLMLNAVLEKPWAHITVDFITKLLLAQKYNSILVVCDRITKMAHFVPTIEKTLVVIVVRLF